MSDAAPLRSAPMRLSACVAPDVPTTQIAAALRAVVDLGDPPVRRITDRSVTLVVPDGTVIFEQVRANLIATWREGRRVRGRFMFPWRQVTDMPTTRDAEEHVRPGIRSLIASTRRLAMAHLSPESLALGEDVSLLEPNRLAASIAAAAHGLDVRRLSFQHPNCWAGAMLVSTLPDRGALGEAEDSMRAMLARENGGAGPQPAHSIISSTDQPGPEVVFDVALIAAMDPVRPMGVVDAMRAIGRRA